MSCCWRSSTCPVRSVTSRPRLEAKESSSSAPPTYCGAKRRRRMRVEIRSRRKRCRPSSSSVKRMSRMMMLLMSTGIEELSFLGRARWSITCWMFSRPVRGSRTSARCAEKRRAEVIRTSWSVMRSRRLMPPTSRLAVSMGRLRLSRTSTWCSSRSVQRRRSTRSRLTGASKSFVSSLLTRLATLRCTAGMRKSNKGRT